jgi:hypothetical protein
MHRQTEVHSVIHYQLYPPSSTLTNSQALETVFAGMPKGDQALIRGEGVAVRWGTLDVLDLLFTPFPQFLPELGIESLLVGKRDTCPSSEILKKMGSITGGRHWKAREYLPCHSAQPQQGRCLRIKN